MGSGRINAEKAKTHLGVIEDIERKAVEEPEQFELDFGDRYGIIADKELDKRVVALLKLLEKFDCAATTVNYIMALIEPTCPEIRCCQKEPEK